MSPAPGRFEDKLCAGVTYGVSLFVENIWHSVSGLLPTLKPSWECGMLSEGFTIGDILFMTIVFGILGAGYVCNL